MLRTPTEPYRIPWLGLYLLDLRLDAPTGCFQWIRSWGAWQDFMIEVGVGHFERLRRSYGIDASLADAPAAAFGPDELHAAVAFSAFPIVFGWDAYFLPSAANYFAAVSHDGPISVVSKDDATESRLLERLADWEPELQPLPKWV